MENKDKKAFDKSGEAVRQGLLDYIQSFASVCMASSSFILLFT